MEELKPPIETLIVFRMGALMPGVRWSPTFALVSRDTLFDGMYGSGVELAR